MKYGMRELAAMVLVALSVGLAGCAGGVPGDVAGSQASSGSGVTVFGTCLLYTSPSPRDS